MDRETLFKIFKQAIQDEENAHAFYSSAAAGISEPEFKKTFELLAKNELGHVEMLKEKYKKLRDMTS